MEPIEKRCAFVIYLDSESGKPLYQQLYQRLTQEILTGQRAAGEQLPPSRVLSGDLGISRNTVNRVYQQLLAEGYVTSRMGSGFYVNRLDPELLPARSECGAADIPEPPNYRYHFFYGTVSSSVFPHSTWRKCMNDALTKLECSDFIGYPARPGEAALRRSIAAYLRASRGVNCRPAQVIITSGHQQSMELLARMFSDSGKRLAIEDPGYDGIRTVFENNGYEILPVSVEHDGICLEELQRVKKADLFYLTPAHQFPLGCLTPVAKRLSILSWARNADCYVIEDDYDSELRYSHTPVPSMQSLDPSGHVIYAGTFSKCFSPSVRTAYLVLPEALLPRFERWFWRYNAQVSPIIQQALADFIDSGAFIRHISRLRTHYRRQQTAFLAALHEIFGSEITVYGEGAGLHVLVDFGWNVPADALIASAARAGIGLYSPAVNYIRQEKCPPSMLLLGFANLSAESNKQALRLLREQWQRDGLMP